MRINILQEALVTGILPDDAVLPSTLKDFLNSDHYAFLDGYLDHNYQGRVICVDVINDEDEQVAHLARSAAADKSSKLYKMASAMYRTLVEEVGFDDESISNMDGETFDLQDLGYFLAEYHHP